MKLHGGSYSAHITITPRGLAGLVVFFWTLLLPGYHMAEAQDTAAASQTLTICLPTGVESFDPTQYRSRMTQTVLRNIFDSLTARNDANQVVPGLARSWRLIDGTYWRFKLFSGVRFHNGDPFSAADVKFTLDRVIADNPLDGGSPRKSLLAPIAEIIAEDELTVGIRTRHPWPDLPLMLSLQEIMPARYTQEHGGRYFEAHPMGTGPFRFVRADPGKETVLARFEPYFGGPAGDHSPLFKPVRQLVFTTVPSDLDRVAMLKTGRCDIIVNLPPKSIPIVEMHPGLQIVRAPATRSYFAEINCSRPPLDDRRIRQALNHAVDVDAFIKHELNGRAIPLATVVLPNAFAFDPDLSPYSRDLSAARNLLKSAGDAATRSLVIMANPDDLVFAGTIALGLTRLGMHARVVTATTYRPRMTGLEVPWDIFVGSWGNTSLVPAGILVPKFKTGAAGNFSGFASPDLDRLLDDAQSTMETTLRRELYHRVQALIFEEAPMVFGYATDEYYGVARRVKNFHPPAHGMLALRDIALEER